MSECLVNVVALIFALSLAANAACTSDDNCRKITDQELERTLVDLRSKTVLFMGDDEENMRCIEKRAASSIAEGKSPKDELRIEVFRAGLRYSWKDINAKHAAALDAEESRRALPALKALSLEAPERVISRLDRLLKSPAVGIRMKGAEMAGKAGARKHIPRIIELFATESGMQLERYEDALVALDAGNELKQYILSADANVGHLVAPMARILTSDPDLIDLVGHTDPSVRRIALLWLGTEWNTDGAKRAEPETIIKTLGLSANDTTEDVARAATQQLKRYANSESRQKTVIRLMKEKDKALELGLCLALKGERSNKKHFKKFARSSNKKVEECGKRTLDKFVREDREEAETEAALNDFMKNAQFD